MERSHILTADGSSSLFVPSIGESYHSKHGAVQESQCVFINRGLSLFKNQEISVLEFGFGTGLNALLTWLYSERFGLKVNYVALEKYPLQLSEWSSVNYPQRLDLPQSAHYFEIIHDCKWQEKICLDNVFSLQKLKKDFKSVAYHKEFDLVYYDAFSPYVQPDLWTEEMFLKISHALKQNGIMVTYCAKGEVRRILQHVGFKVERLPGPPGKREMLRAFKL